jgi:hypothetical protein
LCWQTAEQQLIPALTIASTVTSKPKKKDNDRMTMKFLLHKDKEEK